MASKSCPACFKALRRASRATPQSPIRSRTFTTRAPCFARLPEPNATAATSIPPVTPQKAPSDLNTTKIPASIKVVAEELRRVTGRSTETYAVYGVTEILFKECAKQADYSIPQATDPNADMPKTDDGEDLGVGSGWWHTELSLKPTFSTWSQITMLHMYILSARFRCFAPSTTSTWQQHLLDHFFYDAEHRMTINHNMHARGTRNKYLKDLFIQWRGLLAAYDEGLFKGDAVLAAAVWRNVFKGDKEVDVQKVAIVVSYLRRILKGLEGVPDETVAMGQVVFGDPGREAALVSRTSQMMSLPFTDGKVVNEPATT